MNARYPGICTRTSKHYSAGTEIVKGTTGWEISADMEALAESISFPEGFYAGGKYICRLECLSTEVVYIVISSDSTGNDQIAYNINTHTFENRRAKSWNAPSHRKELEAAFLVALLESPVKDLTNTKSETAPAQIEQPVGLGAAITLAYTDRDVNIPQRGQLFEQAPGVILKCVNLETESITDDGYSIGLGSDSGTMFTAHCVPATADQIARFTEWQAANKAEDKLDTFSVSAGRSYMVTRINESTLSIRPYLDAVGGYGADACAEYYRSRDMLTMRMLDDRKPAFEAAFREWMQRAL